ncbi:hypothetical protein PIB30_057089 [Stylosanthes scabra]|uniref:Uncharacterized protein n=1 Tax=Stylosanthes scabra TaxID=79078 RepID=A0ABU6TJC9_9FABA|nr:hypothetical protein [Stylosanthes scabra]
MVKKAQPLFATQSCCIYKVPHSIRQLKEDAYTPKIISIGPLHHGNPRLVTMEAHKQVYCQHLFQRSEASLSDLVSCVQQMEPQIRACYSEKINLTEDELVKVIFIDCCFIIEFFLRDEWMRNDVIPSKPWMDNQVRYDLIYFSYYNKQSVSPPAASSIAHFTDLIRYFCLPPSHPSRNPGLLVLGHGASELFEAGVKFTVNESSSSHGCMLALEFKDATLRIPHIAVSGGTEIWLRNIVALEQCHYPYEHYILDYVVFLGHIMKTSKDAVVFIKAEIIDCIFGGDCESKVAKLFGDVGKETLVVNTNVDYLKIRDDLNAYYCQVSEKMKQQNYIDEKLRICLLYVNN